MQCTQILSHLEVGDAPKAPFLLVFFVTKVYYCVTSQLTDCCCETAFRQCRKDWRICKSTTTSLPWESLRSWQIVVHANLVCDPQPMFCFIFEILFDHRYIQSVVGPCKLAIDIAHISCSTHVSYPHNHWMISQSVVKPVKRRRIFYFIHILK